MTRTKYGRDVFPIMARRCSECLFGPNKIVSNERRAEILKECKQGDSHFLCHKGSIAGEEICCRGFYEKKTTNLIRIAERMNRVIWIDPDTIEQVEEPGNDE